MSILIKGIPLAGYEISIMKDGERYRARVDGIWCEVEEIPTTDTDSDTISRQTAIDALNHECCCGAVIDHCGLETAMDIISELPPTQTERITSRWIPCGERLPENDNDVLVQMNDGSMMVDYRAASSNGWFWAELDDEPVAWMPLPEPYKGVTE